MSEEFKKAVVDLIAKLPEAKQERAIGYIEGIVASSNRAGNSDVKEKK